MNLDDKTNKVTVNPKDMRKTTCTVCKHGIFDDNYIWSKLGLIHRYCVEELDNES